MGANGFSEYNNILVGEPQATNLGPFLWFFDVNDLEVEKFNVVKYPDETTFYKSVTNPLAKSIMPAIENSVMVSQKQNAAEFCCMRIASYIYIYIHVYWFQTCLAFIQILLFKCIISNMIVATEPFHVGRKMAWQYFEDFSDNINSGAD